MDKYEYRICLEDIQALIGRRDFVQAVEIADTIDWNHVKSVKTLCMISDLYKINGRIEQSYAVLVQAYNRQPDNPKIVYALCDLLIRQKQMLSALQLYNEFTRLAPMDPSRFVLQYQLYQLQNVSLDERIAVLKDLERHSFRDKWVLELAKLYEEQGRYQDCAAQCDKLIERGKPAYQKKAIQLKQKYASLTAEQKEIYRQLTTSIARQNTQPLAEAASEAPFSERGLSEKDSRSGRRTAGRRNPETDMDALVDRAARMTGIADTEPITMNPGGSDEIRIRGMDEQLVNTVDLQREVADGLRDIMTRETDELDSDGIEEAVNGGEPQRRAGQDRRGGFDLPEEEENAPEAREEFERARQEVRERRAVRAGAGRGAAYEADLAQETDGQYSMRLGIDGRNVISRPDVPEVPEPSAEERQLPETEPAEAEDEEALRAYEEARQERLRESAPKGRLSDGMTGQEKLAVALAKQANEPAGQQDGGLPESSLQDTLVLDESADASTRTWIGSSVERALAAPSRQPLRDAGQEEEEALFAEEYADGKEPGDDSGAGEPEENIEEPDVDENESGAEAAQKHTEEKLSETQEIAELVRLEFENNEQLARQQAAAEAARRTEEEAAHRAEVEAEARRLVEEKEREAEENRRREEEAEAQKRAERMRAERARRDAELDAGLAEASAVRAANAARENMETAELQKIIMEEDRGPAVLAEEGREAAQETVQDASGETPHGQEEEPPVRQEKSHYQKAHYQEGAPRTEELRRREQPESREDRRQQARRAGSASERIRNMTPEQRKLFTPFLHEKNTREQLLETIDSISLASYTGNVVITGDEENGATDLAKALLRNVHMTDINFSGKVAVTTGSSLNRKGPTAYLARLENGGLIVDHASTMTRETVEALNAALEKEDHGAIVLLTDTRKNMDRFWGEYEEELKNIFTTRVDIRPLSIEELMRYAERYAERQDCVMDESGRGALEDQIAGLQTETHRVTVEELRELIDSAVTSAERKTAGHFMDSVLRKRYDSEDRIILRDKDFRR
ncbi:tetratricopeptide repeat protein [Lachnoclostridium sp. Marseille-P6806]|uniref:tetratricopeptide repeat protein n=1 Tax=Lachnoclostridium sp. Marseille-P6806 TaxID=2364793 RepID=UPI00102F9381|nr:hypothetical protein [Lachnoclostridium sp. Marseille-P6806]